MLTTREVTALAKVRARNVGSPLKVWAVFPGGIVIGPR